MNKFLTAIFIMILIPLMFIGKNAYSYSKQTDQLELGALVLVETDSFSESPTVILSYFGYMREPVSPDELYNRGKVLSELLELPVGEIEIQKNTYPGYVVQSQNHNQMNTTLKLVSVPDHSESALSLTIQSSGRSSAADIYALKTHTDEMLADITNGGAWTSVVQGNISTDTDSIIRELSDKFKLKELGLYKDAGTVSISYHSMLEQGPQKTNFQLAFHRNSETGQVRLTIGTPAIHVEY